MAALYRKTYSKMAIVRTRDNAPFQCMMPQAVYQFLNQRRLAGGIEECRLTFASMSLHNDKELKRIRDTMGHASVITLQKYG